MESEVDDMTNSSIQTSTTPFIDSHSQEYSDTNPNIETYCNSYYNIVELTIEQPECSVQSIVDNADGTNRNIPTCPISLDEIPSDQRILIPTGTKNIHTMYDAAHLSMWIYSCYMRNVNVVCPSTQCFINVKLLPHLFYVSKHKWRFPVVCNVIAYTANATIIRAAKKINAQVHNMATDIINAKNTIRMCDAISNSIESTIKHWKIHVTSQREYHEALDILYTVLNTTPVQEPPPIIPADKQQVLPCNNIHESNDTAKLTNSNIGSHNLDSKTCANSISNKIVVDYINDESTSSSALYIKYVIKIVDMARFCTLQDTQKHLQQISRQAQQISQRCRKGLKAQERANKPKYKSKSFFRRIFNSCWSSNTG